MDTSYSVACAETSREAAHSPDTELVRRSSLFHPPDIEHIFTQYVDRMYGFFYSRVGNRQDAEDLTSDVFLKASRQLDPTRSEASIGSWLFTVARTVLADHWRRYYRAEVSLPLDEARVSQIRVDDGSDSAVDSARQVAEVLAALPERYSRVLALRFLRGYSIQETAEELGVTTDNVKVIQHRALAKAVEIAGNQR